MVAEPEIGSGNRTARDLLQQGISRDHTRFHRLALTCRVSLPVEGAGQGWTMNIHAGARECPLKQRCNARRP
jgi:hypothetical protein